MITNPHGHGDQWIDNLMISMGIIDFPFSLVLDTVFLLYTVPDYYMQDSDDQPLELKEKQNISVDD